MNYAKPNVLIGAMVALAMAKSALVVQEIVSILLPVTALTHTWILRETNFALVEQFFSI